MLSVEARPLTAAERDFLLAEKAGPPSRAFLIGAAAFVLALLPALGALIGINLGAALGFPSRPSAMAGVLAVLAANAVGAWISWRFMDRMRAWLRRSVARQLATAHQETWRFDAVRAWTIECPVTRAILFELPLERSRASPPGAGRRGASGHCESAVRSRPSPRHDARREVEALPSAPAATGGARGSGDDVTVLGFSSEDGRRMFGTAEWPVLVWLEGTEVDQSGL